MTDLESASWVTATLIGMEAASRWETEAIRESRDRRRARPTVSQQSRAPDPAGDWRTLREASDETGIPLGTLRKWCRRETVDSYLEFDGDQTLRMLEMGSVRDHAKATGRELVKSEQPEESYQPPATSHQPEPPAVLSTQYPVPSTQYLSYLMIFVTRPAPTVRPPSRIANRNPSSIAIDFPNTTVISVLSPGITISVPDGNDTEPVTSVVRK